MIVGPNRAKFWVQTKNNGSNNGGNNSGNNREPIDEIEEYWSGWYLALTEGTWRILGYSIMQKTPSVTALPVHLPDSIHHKHYQCSNPSPTLSNLKHYFARPEGTFLDGTSQHRFKDLCYTEYFVLFQLQKFDEQNVGRPGYYLEHSTDQGAPVMHVVQWSPL